VKTKISWCNRRWHLGENRNIVAQQKKGIAVKQKYRGATEDGIVVKSKVSW
jgi:hypothetical protein